MSAAGKRAGTPGLDVVAEATTRRMLPTAARERLGEIVTELSGVAKALRAEIIIAGDDEDYHDALSKWVDRIADELARMECREYRDDPSETTRRAARRPARAPR
jgi:hypothetical protein